MPSDLRILLIEDSPRDAELEERQLKLAGLSFVSRRVETKETLIEQLQAFDPHLVISDFSMPRFDGVSALRTVRELRPDIPFIFVSGNIGEEVAVESLRNGATDYILKDRLGSLAMRVERALKEAADRKKQHGLEEQLRQAQKMEAVGRLAGGVAHDFNNILTVICGYSELLLSSPFDPQSLRQNLEEIQKAGQRGTELTRQLLTFSRKRVVEPAPLDLGKVVSGLEKMLGRLVGSDVKISTTLPPGLWKVTGDLGQMEQVIVNLVANARDAMPKGGRITIETSNVTVTEQTSLADPDLQPGSYVLLAVTDTGTGIPAEVMKHLFEPFFTTKDPGRGTGLGLSMVHGIVKQAGGAIDVTSEVGRGTTIKVHFPRGGKETTVRSATPESKPRALGLATILIVEDQESVRHLASSILGSSGHKVLVAGDGVEALRISEEYENRIDLLLSDLVLRTMSGVELGGLVRRFHPEARLLLMSGYAYRNPELHDLIAAGLPFLEKPFSVDGLRRKVAEILGGSATPEA